MTESEKQQQKLAALGMLSAGIAHEIQNPLNFVINFSKMSDKLLKDLKEIINDVADNMDPDDAADIQDIADDLSTNMQKIQEHGERAISIIQGILLISRGNEGEHLPTDISHLMHEYIWLSYHAKRANDKSFNVSITEDYQTDMPKLMVVPQDLSRAVLNVVNNAAYSVKERTTQEEEKKNTDYKPEIKASATYEGGKLIIKVSDNGTGIPEEVQKKLFHETITTKPVGQGTGLGMQITHDIIVNTHKGEIKVDSKVGEGTTITFIIPTDSMK